MTDSELLYLIIAADLDSATDRMMLADACDDLDGGGAEDYALVLRRLDLPLFRHKNGLSVNFDAIRLGLERNPDDRKARLAFADALEMNPDAVSPDSRHATVQRWLVAIAGQLGTSLSPANQGLAIADYIHRLARDERPFPGEEGQITVRHGFDYDLAVWWWQVHDGRSDMDGGDRHVVATYNNVLLFLNVPDIRIRAGLEPYPYEEEQP